MACIVLEYDWAVSFLVTFLGITFFTSNSWMPADFDSNSNLTAYYCLMVMRRASYTDYAIQNTPVLVYVNTQWRLSILDGSSKRVRPHANHGHGLRPQLVYNVHNVTAP